MAYGKKMVYTDKRRGAPMQKEEYQKHGVKDLDKAYQAPSNKYTNGKTADVKQAPPKKPKQKYGKKGPMEVPGNKGFKVGKKKGSLIKSIDDIRKARKKKYGY